MYECRKGPWIPIRQCSASLALLLILLVVVSLGSGTCSRRSRARARGGSASSGPVVLESYVSIAYPPPAQRPMVPSPGLVRYGYPTQSPDRVALRATLFARRFDLLTEWMESYQRDARADSLHEYWPVAAVMAFRSNDPRLRPLLDEWCAANAWSWAPFAARAAHFVDVGESFRGEDLIRNVSSESVAKLDAAFAATDVAIDAALAIEPRLLPMYTLRLTIERHRGDRAQTRATYERAHALFPRSFELPSVYAASLEPRWGGIRGRTRSVRKRSVGRRWQPATLTPCLVACAVRVHRSSLAAVARR